MKNALPMSSMASTSTFSTALFFTIIGFQTAIGQTESSVLLPIEKNNGWPETIVGERVPIGSVGDYKPCIVRFANGELVITTFRGATLPNGQYVEPASLFRSFDGGKRWSREELPSILGREPYVTVTSDGTMLMTTHLLDNDSRNIWGYVCGFIHRSADRGKTWISTRVESEGINPGTTNTTSRNVCQLANGTLLLGVDYADGLGPYFVWKSRDKGLTWEKNLRCVPRDFASQYGFFGGETWLWQSRLGRIWALVRVDSTEIPVRERPFRPIGNPDDQTDHTVLFVSSDEGASFDRVSDIGDYGDMYMSLLRLQDDRLLATWTVRGVTRPFGVRATVGAEINDVLSLSLEENRIILDSATGTGTRSSGGGFGPTIQLDDGTLVTAYSYRGADAQTYVEVVRWNAPAQSFATEARLPPTITSSPKPQTVGLGDCLNLEVSITPFLGSQFVWKKNGVPLSGQSARILSINKSSPSDEGLYSVTVSNARSSITSSPVAVVVQPTRPSRLVNISVLGDLAPNDQPLTVGAVLGGEGTFGGTPLAFRAIGPSLAQFEINEAVSDPRLAVFDGNRIIATNDNWGNTQALRNVFARVGAFGMISPTSRDAAAFNPAQKAGPLTMQSVSQQGESGKVLVELYHAAQRESITTSTPRIINLSVLKKLMPSEILTVGFVIEGSVPQQVLIRAIGPALSDLPFGVLEIARDPNLRLFRESTQLEENDDWGGRDVLATAGVRAGAFAISNRASKDAVLLSTLAPGAYSIQAADGARFGGNMLIEVYELRN